MGVVEIVDCQVPHIASDVLLAIVIVISLILLALLVDEMAVDRPGGSQASKSFLLLLYKIFASKGIVVVGVVEVLLVNPLPLSQNSRVLSHHI